MRNLADIIESFIISELLQEHKNTLLVQRNELAERLDCAPSQISYVLSTRFTPERGFVVESRRGSGGFVRIVRRQPLPTEPQQEPTAAELLDELEQQHVITVREQALLRYLLQRLTGSEEQRKQLLQQAVAVLAKAGRR